MRYDTVHAGGTGSFLLDGDGTIVGFDGAMERLTGWTASDVIGRAAGGPLLLDGVIRSGFDATELALLTKDGSVLDVEAALHHAAGDERTMVSIVRVVARNVGSNMPQSEGRDPLTGLANRTSFLARLGDELYEAAAASRPLAIVVADVDHLRKIADTRGRDAATTVIKKLAGILRATVSDDDLAARFGEDDFAIILNGLGRGSARQIAARLRSTIDKFQFTSGTTGSPFRVTLSLGAASFPTDADNPIDLLARAMEALDEARTLGRNRVWCYMRRPRVPLRAPVYLEGASAKLLGFSHDLSPSGLFVATPAPIDVGMRCALSFPLPTAQGKVHVIGRVVRTVPIREDVSLDALRPGMGVEFERFGPEDRRAIEAYLFENESRTLRPEGRFFSV